MTAGWEPRPGTVAFRVLAHLATLPAGAERMTSHLADALGLDVNGVTPCLESALKARRVFARKRDSHVRSPLWWSLTDNSKDSGAVDLESAADGSQKPNGGMHGGSARAGSETPREGANRDASAEQSHDAEGSDSPAGRGGDAAPAVSAAPVFLQPEGAAAIAGRPARAKETAQRGAMDATVVAEDPGAGDDAKPAVGAAAPNGLRIALWSDGTLQIVRVPASDGVNRVLSFTKAETRQLVEYLDRVLLDRVEVGN
jgi:hypothetical protein